MPTTYHIQTNRKTEATNKTLEGYLRCYMGNNPKGWSNWLNIATIPVIIHPSRPLHLKLPTVTHPQASQIISPIPQKIKQWRNNYNKGQSKRDKQTKKERTSILTKMNGFTSDSIHSNSPVCPETRMGS